MKKPRIGLICFVFQSISVRNYMIQKGYVKGIIDAGGIPVLIPVTEDPSRCAEYMDMIDGLLVPGGEDIAPEYYGEDPVPQVNYINRDKDRYDFELIRLAREQKKPIFGICRGFQVLNVAFGRQSVRRIFRPRYRVPSVIPSHRICAMFPPIR